MASLSYSLDLHISLESDYFSRNTGTDYSRTGLSLYIADSSFFLGKQDSVLTYNAFLSNSY